MIFGKTDYTTWKSAKNQGLLVLHKIFQKRVISTQQSFEKVSDFWSSLPSRQFLLQRLKKIAHWARGFKTLKDESVPIRPGFQSPFLCRPFLNSTCSKNFLLSNEFRMSATFSNLCCVEMTRFWEIFWSVSRPWFLAVFLVVFWFFQTSYTKKLIAISLIWIDSVHFVIIILMNVSKRE